MQPAPRFLHERIDGDEVWVDLEAGRFYGVNETAAAILEAWRDGVHEPAAIAARLAGVFDADAQAIEPEVIDFLDAARARGLLEA